MDRLEQMLQDSEIEYTEKIFKTEDGIGGIGDQIFVSIKQSIHLQLKNLILDCIINLHYITITKGSRNQNICCGNVFYTRKRLHL